MVLSIRTGLIFALYGWTQEEYQRNDQLPGYPELEEQLQFVAGRHGNVSPTLACNEL